MIVRRAVVEFMWVFLGRHSTRSPWEKLALLMSVDLREFGIGPDDELPNRWELAMAVNPKEILIVGNRIFEPLILALNTLDGAMHHIRSRSEPIQKGSSVVAIVIGTEKKNNQQICHIDTAIWNEIQIKTHSIVKTKKNPQAIKKLKKLKHAEQDLVKLRKEGERQTTL